MDANAHFDNELREHVRVAEALRARLAVPFREALALWARAVRDGNKLLFFGNGGSAADAQHFATELVVRFSADRPAIAALALTTDTSALTAGGNDLGFEQVFARQVEALGRAGDVAVAISTSGRSRNVVAALESARALGLKTVALTGGDGGALLALADVALVVPSAATPRIQEMHLTIGHMLCGALEVELGLVPEER